MNLNNLRECIENSPRLKYSYKMKTDSCINGVADSYTIEGECLADYANKTATVITKRMLKGGVLDIDKVVYKDSTVSKNTLNSFLDANPGLHVVETKMQPEEYNELFSPKGALRPVNFDLLHVVNADSNVANSMSFTMDILQPEAVRDWDITARTAITLYSEDTLCLTTLSSQVSRDNSQNMSVVVNEMTIHMC